MIFLISMIIMITMLFGGALGLISNEVNGNAKIWLFSLGLTLIALAAIRAIIHLNYSQILEKLSSNTIRKHPNLSEEYESLIAKMPETTNFDLFMAAAFLHHSPRLKLDIAYQNMKFKATEE